MHSDWQQAQEQALEQTGCNFVFLPDDAGVLCGNVRLGWMVVSAQANMQLRAATAQGVHRVLEELQLPRTGWH